MNVMTTANLVAERAMENASAALIATLDAPAAFKAAALAALNIQDGRLVIITPDARRLAFGDPMMAECIFEIRDYSFANRILRGGDIGLAEGYIEGEWDTPNLAALLTLLSRNADRIMRIFRGNPATRFLHGLMALSRQNTRRGSRKNILAHYDLGNAFYETWLDETMTYSAARFDRARGASLADAQWEKYRSLAESMHLAPGDRVLEIGCGWGGFAEFAASEYGAEVTGLTISDEQFLYAQARMQRAGLSDRVRILRTDYRDIGGRFDKVASIEMLEAVGEKYWPAFFRKVRDVLVPGGRAGLQVITIRDELFDDYRSRIDFIQRYVFPGGMLPSVARLREETARAGFALDDVHSFGASYADTLALWNRRFLEAWPRIEGLGFDRRFKRLWQFYLAYCEAGFRTERTDVIQFALEKH